MKADAEVRCPWGSCLRLKLKSHLEYLIIDELKCSKGLMDGEAHSLLGGISNSLFLQHFDSDFLKIDFP